MKNVDSRKQSCYFNKMRLQYKPPGKFPSNLKHSVNNFSKELWGFFFWNFKDFLMIFAMFVNMDMCEIVLIISEGTAYDFSAVILLSY